MGSCYERLPWARQEVYIIVGESEAGKPSRTLGAAFADAYREAGVARFMDTGVERFMDLAVLPAFHNQIATIAGQLNGSYGIQGLMKDLGVIKNLAATSSAVEAITKNQKIIGNAIKFTDAYSAVKLANVKLPSLPTYANVLGPTWKPPEIEFPEVRVRHDPTPDLLQELIARFAEAAAAETTRANAAEKRLKTSHWLNVGMFVLTIATLIVTMVVG